MKTRTLRFGLIVLVLTAAAGALSAAETFNPFHVAKLRSVTTVSISPDGSKTAYVLSVPRQPLKEDDGPAWEELHLLSRDGVSRALVTGEVNVSVVAWIPDGRGIAFLAKRGKDDEKSLYVIPSDGGEARRVLAHGAEITAYSFRPDGQRVAFLAKEPEPKEQKELAKKGFNQEIFEESAKPVRLWVAALEKGEAKGTTKLLEVAGSASELHWSPAGARLAVAIAPTSLVDQSYTSRKVHVLDADSGKVLARLENPGKLGDVAWSPDGKFLALVSAADPNDPAEGRLMVASASGGALRDVLPGYEGHVRHIAWQDAETVMFLADEGVWTTFGEVRRDGSGRKTHIGGEGPVLASFSLSRDGQSAALVGETPRHPGEVFLSAHEAPKPRRVTTSNPWLPEMGLAQQEVVKFKARDGIELEGILIRPFDEKKGSRYPLILTVHGGPEANFRNGWLTSYSNPGQVGAAEGFAVFYPNYRGSTGRGVAFSKLSHGDPAGKEFDDLVDAVDHLIAAGLVDKAKVGITGGSYGGYATGWGATYYTDRFAAGVMFVGISDKVSKWGTTDIPEEEFLVHARHRVWEEWDLFRERSPIFHAGKSKTPLLILGGKDDPRVHPSQSLALYRHLKARSQAPVRLVLYPGERHGNRRAASRLDYNLRMLRWMEHYLKGPGGVPPPYEIDYNALRAEMLPDAAEPQEKTEARPDEKKEKGKEKPAAAAEKEKRQKKPSPGRK